MKVLFATTNQAKILRYRRILEENGVDLITIKDLGFKLTIDESGKDAIENARIKAKAYFDATHIPTIGMDNNLFIEGLPDDKQPGTHVKRINGKELTDDEMIDYYTSLVKEYGGKLTAKWVYGIVFCDDNKSREFSWNKEHFYLIDKPSKFKNPGYPLDSISLIPEFGKYLVELTQEEKAVLDKADCANNDVGFLLDSIMSK